MAEMHERLKLETEKLTQSWMRHESDVLRDYLVSGVEDPRINLQSILSRHFVIRSVLPRRFEALMLEEYRFSAVMNWLLKNSQEFCGPELRAAVLYSLRQGADNAEGVPIPYYVSAAFQSLPILVDEMTVPNYLEQFLNSAQGELQSVLQSSAISTFEKLWSGSLAPIDEIKKKPTLLEPACGSANDFRFMAAYGVASLVDYSGMDLCPKNVLNARVLFPSVPFQIGNVFSLPAGDREFDLCFVHDLFEHLSVEGFQHALAEVCRCTSKTICVGFFNMQEIQEHRIVPHEHYHWNTLSLQKTRDVFREHGFAGQVIHIGEFLKDAAGCDDIHNPNAYTFILSRQA